MAEVKRGFRKVTLVLPVKEYDLLTKIAEASDREPGQQASYLIKQALYGLPGQFEVEEVVKSPTWDNGTAPDAVAAEVE